MSTETRHFNQYELRERLWQDGMVDAWKAFDTQLQRYVVIKFPHANLQNDLKFVKRIESEAEMMVSLHHRGLVQIYDAQVSRPPQSESTIAYIVTDYIEGQTLADYIANTSRAGNFPLASDIVHIFTAISSAVDYAHQKGITYCDVKPTNILLDKHGTSPRSLGEPVLVNFEIPTLLGNSSNAWTGTAPYISPEQARGYSGNERSDIYALGVILYEICTGAPPFRGENPTDVMMQHINAAPTPPEQLNRYIPPALSEVILRSLAKDPMARFPNAAALASALADAFNMPTSVVSTRPVPVTPLPFPSSPPKRRQRNPLLVALIVLLLLVLAGSGLGAFALFSNLFNPVAANQIVGHAYFDSSGQFIENSTNGINDELHLTLQNVPSPARGKNYYLWLLSDMKQKRTTFISLGTVQVSNGNVKATYTTLQHTNLIATTSRLLITEENATPAPSSFSPVMSTWRYYSVIPQTHTTPGVPHSSTTLDFLRLLLFEGTKLAAQGLHGGSAIRLLRNTQKVLEWSGSARDEWDLKNFPLMHRHFIRILDYLDGSPFVQADVPPGTPLLVNPILAQNGLVMVIPGDNPEAYTPRIAFHILSASEATHEFSPEKAQLALETERDVRVNVEYHLQQVRRDAKQLVMMTDAQLAQRSILPLLNDMLTQAGYAYAGQFDPASGHLKGGVLNDYYDIQTIAGFDIAPYTSK